MTIGQLISLFFDALFVLILISVLGSWVPSLRYKPWFRAIDQVVEPLLAPFRRLLPPQNVGGLDLSPLFLILALRLVESLLHQLFPILWRIP